MADAISAATIAAVDRHLAHLGLYPRSDSAGLAPVAPPPPTDGGWGPHHTLLRSRTVLCCAPCSLTVHFRGPRPCSSAPSDGRVLWTPPHTPPLPYSTLLRPLLPYSTLFAGLVPVAPLPRRTGAVDPTTHSSAPVQYSAAAPAPVQYSAALQPLAPATSAVFTAPTGRSGGKRQPLPRLISRLVSPMLHCSPWLRAPRVLMPPVALGASKPTVALTTPSKASYTANLSLPFPLSLFVPSPPQVYHVYTEDPHVYTKVRPLMPNLPLSSLLSPAYSGSPVPLPLSIASSGPLCLRPRFYCTTKTLIMSTSKINIYAGVYYV